MQLPEEWLRQNKGLLKENRGLFSHRETLFPSKQLMNPWFDGRQDVFPRFIHLPIHPSVIHPSIQSVFLFVFADVKLLELPLIKREVDNMYVYFYSPPLPLGPFFFFFGGGGVG